MSAKANFDKIFRIRNLKNTYADHVQLSRATGIDNLTQQKFWKILKEEISIISRKSKANTYSFTKYKLKLVSKGRGKSPREISIPTIRDRICLRALCDLLMQTYKHTISFALPQDTVRQVKEAVNSGQYNSFIKLDVSNFYPSIDHDMLLKRLRSKVRSDVILNLIDSAIKTPTVSKAKKEDLPNTAGVPQGLAISNVLAAIYLINIDRKLSNNQSIKYFRYVDDILILCDTSDVENITKDTLDDFKQIKLDIHDPIKTPEKSSIGIIGEKFDYLGYEFKNKIIHKKERIITTARSGSYEKLRESLVSIFTGYKHSKIKSIEFLAWRLDMRITGCVFQEKSRGWLFFFSEIDDESILHKLDLYVEKLKKRFKVVLTQKSFVRAFHEISHRRHETTYVPNFDNYNIDQMKDLLQNYFNKSINDLTDEEIEYEFKKRIDRQSRELLIDLATNSSAS